MDPDTVTSVEDLDPDSPTPLWEQMANGLRADIVSGALTGRLPGEQALALRFRVSRDTVRHALAVLRDEELIVPARGRGTFVKRR
jgi:DNA-binding GntR family transcriptional regulator